MIGDAVIAAFFSAEKPKPREETRKRFQSLIEADLKTQGMVPIGSEPDLAIKELRSGRKAIPAFHWELEFPEVFTTDDKGMVTGGFDVIVGNPPYGGKNTTSSANVTCYPDWLKQIHIESHGNADVVAHFFRQAFNLLRQNGTFGLIATKTIREGDTRTTGMRWICKHGGVIFAAQRRLKWPGLAAVIVSIVHVMKGRYPGPKRLDGREGETITAFLFHRGSHDDPARLAANTDKSFIGSYVLGMGFTFDDTDTKGVATPVSGMRRLIDENPRNAEVIFPFIGYSEVANSPTHAHHRYVINFGERSEEECRRLWPDLMDIVEAKVKPERQSQGSIVNPNRWWLFARPASGLLLASRDLNRVLVAGSQASSQFAFAFLPKGMVYSTNLCVIAVETFTAFAFLQSRVHEVWARFFMSTMKDDLAYTPTTCFETFPLLPTWRYISALEVAGREYCEFRAAVMIRNNEGLTKTYNRFHDPDERDPDTIKLRELHAAMDRIVLDTYDWRDIATECEFLLDYDIDEDWGDKKKPYRYRWPDEIRDEVLARLLELNRQRALEEGQLLPAADDGLLPANGKKDKSAKMKPAKKKSAKEIEQPTPGLFTADKGDA
jgi:Eco57I restriction-modification methylase